MRAGCLNDELPGVTVKQRSGLSQDGGFLRVIDTHEAERLSDSAWVGLARQLLTLPLLSSSRVPPFSSPLRLLLLADRRSPSLIVARCRAEARQLEQVGRGGGRAAARRAAQGLAGRLGIEPTRRTFVHRLFRFCT